MIKEEMSLQFLFTKTMWEYYEKLTIKYTILEKQKSKISSGLNGSTCGIP